MNRFELYELLDLKEDNSLLGLRTRILKMYLENHKDKLEEIKFNLNALEYQNEHLTASVEDRENLLYKITDLIDDL